MSTGSKQKLVPKRPRQPNISFFAFTATPKFKTRAVFNEPGSDGKSPFHLYSMRQAIEEGFKGPTEVGTGRYKDEAVVLSQLVDMLNERLGTDFKPADQLFFDQVTEAAVENETLKTAANVNTLDNFKHVFEHMLEGLFIDRMEGNEEIFDRIMQDASFRDVASAHLVREVYERIRTRQKA